MENMDAIYAARLTGLTAPTQSSTQAGSATTPDYFGSLLATIAHNGNSSGTQTQTAAQLQQQVLDSIAQKVDGAPDFLYSLHPKVYEKMQNDPEFMASMLSTVDDWTNSAAFAQAKSGNALSSLLVGQDGEYTTASTALSGLGGGNSILDFVVSSGSLQSKGNFMKFLEQFDALPAEVQELLVQNLDSATVANQSANSGAYDSEYYKAMAAAAEVQKRLLTE